MRNLVHARNKVAGCNLLKIAYLTPVRSDRGSAMEDQNGKRNERILVMLSMDELRTIDTWRFSRRMPSRSAAIRELLRRGLDAEGFLQAEDGAKSASFGVADR